MADPNKLRQALPHNAELILGDSAITLPQFLDRVSKESPIGFVSVDVDTYSSTKKCLQVFTDRDPRKYLPMTMVYLGDIGCVGSSPWVGELLAINEFNDEHKLRTISPETMLRSQRIFKAAGWIDQTFIMHPFDHEWRSLENQDLKRRLEDQTFRRGDVVDNPYLGIVSQPADHS